VGIEGSSKTVVDGFRDARLDFTNGTLVNRTPIDGVCANSGCAIKYSANHVPLRVGKLLTLVVVVLHGVFPVKLVV
jgi:hypothetical protein